MARKKSLMWGRSQTFLLLFCAFYLCHWYTDPSREVIRELSRAYLDTTEGTHNITANTRQDSIPSTNVVIENNTRTGTNQDQSYPSSTETGNQGEFSLNSGAIEHNASTHSDLTESQEVLDQNTQANVDEQVVPSLRDGSDRYYPSLSHSQAVWNEEQFQQTTHERVRVVVSLTSTPGRLPYIYSVLNRIKTFADQPDAIYVNLPAISRRTGKPYIVPEWLVNDPNVTVVQAEMDYGPATKLLPTLKYETDPDTLIVVLDDDSSYHSGMIAKYVEWSRRLPNAALGISGLNVTCAVKLGRDVVDDQIPEGSVHKLFCPTLSHDKFLFIRQVNGGTCKRCTQSEHRRPNDCAAAVHNIPLATDVIEAYASLAVRRGFFDDAVFNFTKQSSGLKEDNCFYRVDDIWFGGYLASKNIDRFIIPSTAFEKFDYNATYTYPTPRKTYTATGIPTEGVPSLSPIDSLHENQHLQKNQLTSAQCNIKGVNYFKDAWGNLPRIQAYQPASADDYANT